MGKTGTGAGDTPQAQKQAADKTATDETGADKTGAKKTAKILPPVGLDTVTAKEKEAIQKRRDAWFPDRKTLGEGAPLFGIGLSGGGIRSASFCLGALQALDAFDMVKRADYLSTVSGGGYIGTGMVASMTRHAGEQTVTRNAGKQQPAATNHKSKPPPYFFPFTRKSAGATSDPTSEEIRDNAIVGHVRDHSKFLIPHGVSDVVLSVGVLARGLAVNLFLILLVIVPLAAITVIANPTEAHLRRSVILDMLAWWCGRPDLALPTFFEQFALSKVLGLAFLVYLIVWGIVRSQRERDDVSRRGLDAVPAPGTNFARRMGLLLVTVFAFELQGPILLYLFETLRNSETAQATLPTLYVALFSLVGGTAALRSKLVGVIEKALANPTFGAIVKAVVSRLLLIVAGLIVPFLIYSAYLGLCLWGIAGDPATQPGRSLRDLACGLVNAVFSPPVCNIDHAPAVSSQYLLGPDWIDSLCTTVVFAGLLLVVVLYHVRGLVSRPGRQIVSLFWNRIKALDWSRRVKLVLAVLGIVAFLIVAALATRFGPSAHPLVPGLAAAPAVAPASGSLPAMPVPATDTVFAPQVVVVINYVLASLFVILAAFLFSPNANSLHSLYRDRLSVAFRLGASREVDAVPMKLTELTDYAPYLLVNATLNARVAAITQNVNRGTVSTAMRDAAKLQPQRKSEGEEEASWEILLPDPVKRGRNAEFFHFSRDYIGSDSTNYAPTARMQDLDPNLSLAAATAISGAAFTSNMGRANIDALSPTLALLNVRLGYWLTNPQYCDLETKQLPPWLPWHDFFRAYLFAEAFGLLRTDSSRIYVTDGGHVDDLGLYQLLRRKCRVIVIVDAEADPAMHFGALVDVERFARIDLGYRITIDFTGMQQAAAKRRETVAGNAAKGTHVDETDPVHADHFAIGKIDYGDDKKGTLIYVKALVTGDEPDYVLDYERRYPSFPHEATSDQFFSEEQMEAYRALGFHAVERALATPMRPVWADARTPEKRAAVRRAYAAKDGIEKAKTGLGIKVETL